MNRRDFLRRTGFAATGLALSDSRLLAQPETIERWRAFEIVTRVEVLKPSGLTRVWLPTPLAVAPYQKTMGDTYHAGSGSVVMVETNANEPDILSAAWEAGDEPVLTLTSRVATTGHIADLTRPAVPPVDVATLGRFLRPTRLIPTDGIVKTMADAITRGAGTDFDRARAIYDWIVEHTYCDPATRGCGPGDVRLMLQSKNFGGKSADLNGLFVGLARAAGLPARALYGLRVAKSRTGARALGLATDEATKAQHCRAEVYLTGYGWVPVDPADVRTLMLEEPPGHLAIGDEKVRNARARLFGSWEMNWIAYNFAHDVTLPGSTRAAIPYFMYPQGETSNGRIDSLDPEAFKYRITVTEV
jgi:transglutaminase-like putative cysteine protease